ncbi:MAG: hypothetical protein AMXMBFR13_17830 [Phycisphaerae bacterium]
MRGPSGETGNPAAFDAEFRAPGIGRATLTMPGLCCGDGAGHVSRALENLSGVCKCEADVLTRSVHVAYDGARCALVDLIDTVQRVGYQVDHVHSVGADGSTP